jgi:hypothetical protein
VHVAGAHALGRFELDSRLVLEEGFRRQGKLDQVHDTAAASVWTCQVAAVRARQPAASRARPW